MLPDRKENIDIKTWDSTKSPDKILIIRIEAMGDLFISFPMIHSLKLKYPNCTIDLITREDYALLPENFTFFQNIFKLKGKFNKYKKILSLFVKYPMLYRNRYDIVIDLQRNSYTRLFRKIIFPKAWTEFDRFSPMSALLRYQWTFNQLQLGPLDMNYQLGKHYKNKHEGREILEAHGWKHTDALLIINPAGAFITRNLPIEKYIEFCRLWLKKKT
jgi:heptosyltransferase-2